MAQLDLLTTPPDFHPVPKAVALDPFVSSDKPMLHHSLEAASAKAEGAYKTISEVSEELDVPAHVLRFWESRFPQVKPQRMRGRRYYRPADLEVLTKIKTLLYAQGYTIKGAKKHVKDKSHEIHSAALEPLKVKAPATRVAVNKPIPVSSITEAVKSAVVHVEAPVIAKPVSEIASAPAKKKLPPELTDLLVELRDLRSKLLAFS